MGASESGTMHAGSDSGEGSDHATVAKCVGREWLIEGYMRALARYRHSSEQEGDPDLARETFLPLFETLNWAASLYDHGRPGGAPRTLRGIILARNRVHHQWADALDKVEYEVEKRAEVGGGVAIVVSGSTFDWFWRPLEELPEADEGFPDSETAKRIYRERLAGRPARDALDELEAFFKRLR